MIASGVQPLQNLVVLIYVGEEKKKEWAQHWINRGLKGETSALLINFLILLTKVKISIKKHVLYNVT